MDLIDWPFVARNALWIVGLSIAFAAWSYTSWWAASRRLKMRRALGLARFQVPFSAGMILFSASLAWGATRWWERALWIVLGLLFAWQMIGDWRWGTTQGWDTPHPIPRDETQPPAPRIEDAS